MNKDDFILKMFHAKPTLDEERVRDVVQRSIDSNLSDGNPRGHRNLIIVMEELSELSKEVAKVLRGKGDHVSVLEELADVKLVSYYLQDICNISDKELAQALNVKVERLDNILKTEGQQL